jgi:hypothetical protein
MPRTGPLRKRVDLTFAPLTVIHAPNEEGKTTVVETLAARLLGRYAADELPAPRFSVARARVEIAVDGETLTLERREDDLAALLRERGWEIGPKLLGLLVVRGADARLLQGRNADLRGFLMALLSRKDRFRTLRDRMDVAGLDLASFHDGVIHTSGRGTWTVRYREAADRHAALSALIADFTSSYADAAIPALRERVAALKAESELNERRRRHHAWKLIEEIRALESAVPGASVSDLERLRDRVVRLEAMEREIETASRAVSASVSSGAPNDPVTMRQRLTAEAGWLDEGVRRIEAETRRVDPAPGAKAALPGALVSLVVAGVLFALGFAMSGFVALGLGALLVAAALLLKRADSAGERERRTAAAWAAEFAERYPDEPRAAGARSLSSLETSFRRRLDETRSRLAVLEARLAELDEKRANADRERLALESVFKRAGCEVTSERWAAWIREELRAIEAHKGKLERARGIFQGLGVREADALAEPIEGEYSASRAAETASAVADAERQLRAREDEFRDRRTRLKQALESAAPEGNDTFDIVSAASARLEEHAAQARLAAATLIAGTLVHRVTEDLLADDRAGVERALSDPMLAETISAFTAGRYRGFGLDEAAGAFVEPSDEEAEGVYACDRLSTGVRDQLFLALRVGLARRLAGESKLFLILDDAFQHADWSRREALVEHTVELVRTGWQAVVFTMDDHLLGLFQRFAAEKLSADEATFLKGWDGDDAG